MKAAELLVKCLENEGVNYIFGLPGEENIDINVIFAMLVEIELSNRRIR